ncbi:mitogen-activated protein kinase kinase kinase 18-like [Spinacia oleracea]|uniref:Mitogen-activated protein kinase kinase kinase 18-like n=1 Tax=Spinacia oleracea TaxID=3562 RepID=A0ABM3QU53_SPIOL|nr:mitogen-activated protein kinase kinase kinase 18-like [Spinacia oleracea]
MNSSWIRGKLIGRGSSAAVSLANTVPSGETFAVKSVEYSKSSTLRKEQEIHSRLKCDQVIEYKGFDVTIENGKVLYNILLEYASGGTLADVIQTKGGGGGAGGGGGGGGGGGRLSDPLMRRYTGEILWGLEYLHCKGFDSSVTEIGGTPLYMAPEVARGEQQSYPADVWALGCTVFEMATGVSPWPNITQDPLSALYHIGFSGLLPEIPDFLPDQAKDFLSKCLKRDPKERWSVAELLTHPFVIDYGPDFGPNMDTPTSILDQGIWETLNLKESQLAHENVAQEGSTKSHIDRIKELMVNSSWDQFPNWDWDEDWITVRSNKISDEENDISSNMGLLSAQKAQPNMTSKSSIFIDGLCLSLTIEHNLQFVNVELLNCCRNTICNCIKCDFFCKGITLAYKNCENNYLSDLLSIFSTKIFSILQENIL